MWAGREAKDVVTNTDEFVTILSAVDTDVQKALVTLAANIITIPATATYAITAGTATYALLAATATYAVTSALQHTQGTDTTLGTMTADINFNGSYQAVGLQAPAANGEAIRATTKITEVLLESATDLKHTQGSDVTLGTMTADINMNTHKLTALSVPSSIGESVRTTAKITEALLESATDLKHASTLLGTKTLDETAIADGKVIKYDSTSGKLIFGTAGGSGESMAKAIAQATHGLVVGNVIKFAAGVYSKAQADSVANAEAVGIVSIKPDNDNFTLIVGGYIDTLSGLTAGSVYYLSAATAGLLTATEPTTVNQVSKPVLIAVSTTAGYFFNFRGMIITSEISFSAKGAVTGLIGDGTSFRKVTGWPTISRNVGGSYASGIWTAPQAGLYYISANVGMFSINTVDQPHATVIYVDNTITSYFLNVVLSTAANYKFAPVFLLSYLAKDATVQIGTYNDGGTRSYVSDGNSNYWSIHLVK